VEVQAVKKAKNDAVAASKTKHKQKLSHVKKLLRDEIVMANAKHKQNIIKLNRQNEAMRQQTSDQRNKWKETLRAAEQMNSVLEQTATAALLEVQSCTRQLHVGSCLTRDLKATLEQVVEASSTKETEVEKLEGTNKALWADLRHVRKQLQEEEARVKRMEKEQAVLQKKVEDLQEELLVTKGKLKGQNLRVLALCQVLLPFVVS